MFTKVLIANRGEIAVRIIKTLQEIGIKSAVIYSDIDKDSLHVSMADEAYYLDGTSPSETYLNIQKIIETANANNIEAIHPGYGFLSENSSFAQACIDSNIVFIGPKPNVVLQMGDKLLAKKIMQEAGIPILPGFELHNSSLNEIINHIQKIEYPVLVKAACGGGGKGMRLVYKESELESALESASREAKNFFGDGRMFIEKYISKPRHIEFQIFGDNYGNVIHLFERECSIQRRHQKIIEESPSCALTKELREKMEQAAIKAAKAIGYTNAGTVEFILDENKNFYFLEVNTRLQVEHPVTESIIHGDLVKAQLLVASGEKLGITQSDLSINGHAIECRIYAEDPESKFFPSAGKLYAYKEPSGPGIRVDSGVIEGSTISTHFDPMIAKLIVWTKNRQSTIEKMLWALSNYPILGIKTNICFLQYVISHPSFKSGDIDTHFIENYCSDFKSNIDISNPLAESIAAYLFSNEKLISPQFQISNSKFQIPNSPWQLMGKWRNN